VPFASTLVSVADFGFALLVLFGLMAFYGIAPNLLGVVLVIPMLLVAFLWSNGLGAFFATLNVKYRDVKVVLPFLVQTLLFLTPVIYPLSFIPDRLQLLTYVNPMAGVITCIRAELVHQGTVSWIGVGISAAVAVAAAVGGTRYFVRSERRFADII